MPRVDRFTAAEAVRALQRAGWRQVRQRGSHAMFRHASRPGLIVVPMHAGRTLKPKTCAAIFDAAGIEYAITRGVEE
jgi:predicted RNA binding protein YcfA (HicA-like mRNA interferase family)